MEKISFNLERPQPLIPKIEDIFKATAVSPETANDVFARWAKTIFEQEMANMHIRTVPLVRDFGKLAVPTWVEQQSIALALPVDEKGIYQQSSEEHEHAKERLLHRMLERLIRNVIEECECGHAHAVVMIGALRSKVHPMGNRIFNFVLKQKFTVGYEDDQQEQ